MTFQPLASSSHGNAYLVSDDNTRILLECGVSYKKLQKLCGFQTANFSGCLVSHEHKDHSACVTDLIKNGVKVYMSGGTAEALELSGPTIISDREQFSIGSMEIVPFATFHDAAEPLGFLIQSADGDALVFATDTVNLGYRFPNLNILAIEANYDKEILARCERMPEKVRRRIANSHMEIDVLCRYLRSLDLSRCREVYLLHLSDATSHEERFINKVSKVIPEGLRVIACRKESG